MYYKIKIKDELIYVKEPLVYYKQVGNRMMRSDKASESIGFASPDKRIIYAEGFGLLKSNSPKITIADSITPISKYIYESVTSGNAQETKPPVTLPTDTESLEYKKTMLLKELSAECEKTIVAGTTVVLSDGSYHFDLTITDQLNMLAISAECANYPDKMMFIYHASGQPERYFHKGDIELILNACNDHRNYNLSYFNSLKQYVNSINSFTELNSVKYGMRIPLQYQTDAFKELKDKVKH